MAPSPVATSTPSRAERPSGPPKLDREDLRKAQQRTLNTLRMRYGLLARMMFKPVDLLYGKHGSFTKFAMLETIARVPYQAWERMGYWAVHKHASPSTLAKRVFERIVDARSDQDNEQWHLLIMQDFVQRQGMKQAWFKHRALPWLISFFYYHVSWLLFLIKPERSYQLNAEFQDHAEHEYMCFVAAHPELETTSDPGTYAAEYGQYDSVADLLRQIGHDERVHKLESLVKSEDPRIRA